MTKKNKKTEDGRIVYFGPTIEGIVRKGTVYIGKIDKKLEKACKETPALAEFIAPIEVYEEKVKELKNPASALSSFFDEIKKNGR